MATFAAPTLASETVFHLGEFEVRNTLLMAWLAMAILIVVALFIQGTRFKLIPGRFQTAVEMVIGGLFSFFNSVVQDEGQTRRFFPLAATILIFLALANWLGILPGVGSITIEGMHDGHHALIPVFRSMNADVNMTLVIAIIAMVAVQYIGLTTQGFSYLGKFFQAPWKNPINTFVGLLEFVGEFTKVISFTFRLFGNIFAGEVLLVVIGFLLPYLAPMPFLGLELFVGFIQAFVFCILTLVFLKMATISHHGEEHSHHAAHA
jgi:F-type H+-transporting ATPase subunit a